MPNIHIKYLNNSKRFYGEKGLVATTAFSAGMDLRACAFFENDNGALDYIDIPSGGRHKFMCGIAFDMQVAPDFMQNPFAGFVYSRSGLGAKTGLCVAQGVGVIDPDYRGEIMVYLLNTSEETKRVEKGDRIAQVIFQPYFCAQLQEVQELSESERGLAGYGHSGVK